MENSEIVQRIRIIQEQNGLTQGALARRISLDPSNLSKIINGRLPVTQSFINRIVVDMGVSKKWLLEGLGLPYDQPVATTSPAASSDGKTPADGKAEQATQPALSPAAVALCNNGVPVYDIDVTAGCTELSHLFTEDKIEGYMSLPRLNPESVIVRVSGNSMHPVISDGSLIAIRPVAADGIISWGSVYVVITDDYRFVKYIRRDRNDIHRVILHSANDDYDDIELLRDQIRALFLVETVVSCQTLC